jgi:hypothetical protein
MDRIPFEVWECIFHNLPSKKDQHQCQSVCKAWHSPAHKVFYQSIYLHSTITLNQFINNLFLYPFGNDIKQLHLYMNESPYTSSTITLSNLEDLMQLCPNVEQVYLHPKSTVWKLMMRTNLIWNRLRILSELQPNPTSRDQNQLVACYKFRKSLCRLHLFENPKMLMNMDWQSYLREFKNLEILGIHFMLVQNVNTILPFLQKYHRLSHLHLVLTKPGFQQQINDSKQLCSLALDFRGDSFEMHNIGCILKGYPNTQKIKVYISKPMVYWIKQERHAMAHLLDFVEGSLSFKIGFEMLGVEGTQLPFLYARDLITQHFLIAQKQPINRSLIFCFFYPSSLESTLYIPAHKKSMDVTLLGRKQHGFIFRSAIFLYSAYATKNNQWISTLQDILCMISQKITTLVFQLNSSKSLHHFQSIKGMRLDLVLVQFPKLETITLYQAKANQIILPSSKPALNVDSVLLWKVECISRHLLFNLSKYLPFLTRLALRSCHFHSPNHRFVFDMHLTSLHYLDIDQLYGYQTSKIPSKASILYKYYVFIVAQKSTRRCFYRVSPDMTYVEKIESDTMDQSLSIYLFFKRLKCIRFYIWNDEDDVHDDWRNKGMKSKVLEINV